jgi:hypothetical protein
LRGGGEAEGRKEKGGAARGEDGREESGDSTQSSEDERAIFSKEEK